MARYDKYDPISGGFRAPLAADVEAENVGVPLGVSLDAQGRVVVGTGGQSGGVGVYVADSKKLAGDIADVMTAGEIVDVEGLAAGTTVAAAADGTIGAGAGFRVGHTVEADRLVVRAGGTA